jgi:hypothetical protein
MNMAKMRFEIRSDVDEVVTKLTNAMQDNESPSYALGYIRFVLVDALMDLPPAKRERQVRWLKQTMFRELELQQDRKDAA